MADKTRPAMSDAERDVLKVLWDGGPGTVRELQERLKGQGQDWTRSTVITLLQRLEKKGYAQSDKSRFAFVFRAAVTREEEMHARISELAMELAEGDAVPLVLAFAQRHRFTREEIERFRRMIDEMEARRRRRTSK
ncbi:MAG: BlaI/MecI/CopY family transcriptional regulator [Planctomycetia bacterium]|nr:BlaI/MecI/CopY family transcriptional regulator [Planctomycetia bacterium]